MAGTHYIMEGVALYCGDDNPELAKYLEIMEFKLPDLQEVMVDHMPGGGKVGVDFAVGVQKLEPTFKLAGWDPSLLRQFGLGSKVRRKYTARGAIRDKATGRVIHAVAVMQARLSRIAPDAFTKGELMGHEYSLNEVMHYEVFFDGQEEMYWDYFSNTLRMGGVDPDPGFNQALGLVSGA